MSASVEQSVGLASRPRCSCAVVIFASRETFDEVLHCVRSVIAASTTYRTNIDVVVNGNAALAHLLAANANGSVTSGSTAELRVWKIDVADKATAWNVYVHQLWPAADCTFFVDGYVRVHNESMSAVVKALADEPPTTYGATGVPASGSDSARLAGEMIKHGGIHGNFHALRKSTMLQIRESGFRLPAGLYRTDGLIGAVLAFGFDPAANPWNSKAIIVVPNACWEFKPLRWWNVGDLLSHLRRLQRQAQGHLENLAARNYLAIERKPPQGLPHFAADLVRNWQRNHVAKFVQACVANPLCVLASRQLRSHRADLQRTDAPLRLL